MFLIRTVFWLVILVLLLPTNEQQQSEVYGTAQAAVKDVSGFCERNPSVCATGKDAFAVFMHKARFGAEMLMSFVKGQTGFAAGDGGTAAGAADMDAPQAPGADDIAPATAEEAGKQSSLDQAGVAEAGIDSWAAAQVTVEPASVEATNSQNTLGPDDLAPAWSGPHPAGT
ncbi:DUF5330 domain-containing protein [Methyloceanibacter sp.]|uniref:DUF5330 domain-containing protein n=1 Tax=Methyloceanibacter sp. TaxID=1965321 RepID=UPI003D6CEDB3